MPAYAVLNLRQLNVNKELVAYLRKIDSTLEPFDGRFLVHGKKGEVVEGAIPGQLIIIEFPGMKHARSWYYSEAYQKILPLRAHNSEGDVVLIDGVPENYKATDLLSR